MRGVRILSIVAITVFAMTAITTTVHAQAPAASDPGSLTGRLHAIGTEAGFSDRTNSTTFAQYIGRIINISMSLLGTIFVAQMVYAGYLWTTARDEADQLEKAKHIIRRSIVGLAIVLSAWAITYFVLSRLYLAAAPGSS
jgi:lysylphosphatidylglycerol synthetase-like protein (DUF2156 family)